jgi:hypothetical protein
LLFCCNARSAQALPGIVVDVVVALLLFLFRLLREVLSCLGICSCLCCLGPSLIFLFMVLFPAAVAAAAAVATPLSLPARLRALLMAAAAATVARRLVILPLTPPGAPGSAAVVISCRILVRRGTMVAVVLLVTMPP